MLNRLLSLFKPRDLHKEGFEFAQEKLAKDGNRAVYQLRSLTETARDFKTWNAFDQGIERAIELYEDNQNAQTS